MLNLKIHCILSIYLIMALTVSAQLVRPLYVYQNIIEGIHLYFNNTCIILLHSVHHPMETQEMGAAGHLKDLQAYLSGLYIRTVTMNLYTLKNKIGNEYFNLKRPLFVLLNDSEELRNEFTQDISTWISMAYPTWLIFFRNETTIDYFFQNIYIPFDCVFLVAQERNNDDEATLTEIYQIDKTKELRRSIFGYWDSKTGVSYPSLSLYQRRGDLFGQMIRVSSIEDPPVSRIIRDSSGAMVGLNGFFGKVVQLLKDGMNCTITFQEAHSWGIQVQNGSSNGVIGMLINNEIDLVAAELMMTTERLNDVEYTTPVYSTKCRTYIKRPSFTAVKWEAYTNPFQYGIWYSLGILIIISSASITFAKSISKSVENKNVNENATFAETTFLVFGAFCGQGMESCSSDTVMIIQLVIHMTGVVIVAAYSAALISFLAVKAFIMPFTTMEGLLNDGTYRFGVVSNSADYNFFQNTSDKVLKVMFNELLDHDDLPSNYLEGLKKVCTEEKYAFMTMDNMVTVLQPEVDCILEPLDIMMQTTIGMAVRKWSPYKGIINSKILMMRDSGILQRLFSTEWAVQSARKKNGWTVVELIDILPLMVFMGSGIFLGGLLLSIEKIIHKILTNYIESKKVLLQTNGSDKQFAI